MTTTTKSANAEAAPDPKQVDQLYDHVICVSGLVHAIQALHRPDVDGDEATFAVAGVIDERMKAILLIAEEMLIAAKGGEAQS